jgi:hypothetical protein
MGGGEADSTKHCNQSIDERARQTGDFSHRLEGKPMRRAIVPTTT